MIDKRAEKHQLRREIAEKRKGYSAEYLKECSVKIFELFESQPFFQSAQKIFLYHSMEGEVSTKDFLCRWMDKKELFLPVIIGDNMIFRPYHSATMFQKTGYGIWEPEEDNCSENETADLIIIPGVAFDCNLNRMGYGKGYYDRFLQGRDAVKVGLCFDFQLFDEIPSWEGDIKMDYVITGKGIIGGQKKRK